MRHLFKNKLQSKNKKKKTQNQQGNDARPVYTDINANLQYIRTILNTPSDLIERVITIGNSQHTCAIVCIDGLVDKNLINEQVIKNLQSASSKKEIPDTADAILAELANEVLSAYELKQVQTMDKVMQAILSGDTALFINGSSTGLIVGSKGWESRSIEEPMTEATVRGPREGFTENIRTNTVLIRRYIRDPNLRFESDKVGRRSKKEIIVCYVEGIVHPAW